MLWNLLIDTYKEIKANQPDIVVSDTKLKKCLLINMTVSVDGNVILIEMEKLAKDKDLDIERA